MHAWEIQWCSLYSFTKFEREKLNAIYLKLPSKAKCVSSGTVISFLLQPLLFLFLFLFSFFHSMVCDFNCMRNKSHNLTELNWTNPLVMLHKQRFVVASWWAMYLYMCECMWCAYCVGVTKCWVAECDVFFTCIHYSFNHSVFGRTYQVFFCHWDCFYFSSFNCIDIPSNEFSFLPISDLKWFNSKMSDSDSEVMNFFLLTMILYFPDLKCQLWNSNEIFGVSPTKYYSWRWYFFLSSNISKKNSCCAIYSFGQK